VFTTRILSFLLLIFNSRDAFTPICYNQNMKKILSLLFLVALFLIPTATYARENVNYWYIKDFQTDITVNKDSSLDITEKIVADCGYAQKHGISRVLPTVQYLEGKTTKSPISLKSITDFDGKSYHYESESDPFDKTITWKIGSENILVTGENNYKVEYLVKNAVRGENEKFDELYWNILGNFWDIPIDSFSAKIHFPEGANQSNIDLNVYSGEFGAKNDINIKTEFTDAKTLLVSYDKTLEPGKGITVSATFPKNIVTPYEPTFWEKYGSYFFYLLPLIVFLICYKLWQKYGRDPKINPTVAPEFEIPEKLSPVEMGLVYSDGTLKNNYISASIINLAVHGFLKIKRIEKKGFFSSEDSEFTKTKSIAPQSPSEEALLAGLFEGKDKVKLSDLKNKFYVHLPQITSKGKTFLQKKDFLVPYSKTLFYVFLVIGIVALLGSFMQFAFNTSLGLASLMSAIIIIVFAPLMQKRSKKGHEVFRKILGFKMYMDKAEKYRQRYLEKENIFEKFLPYAILFGITTQWIKKMKDIYGEEYFNNYHPAWYYGAGIATFNAESFSSQINQVSSNMASTMSSAPSSSGSGGGGFSGGGGGGGGGGGW
jgi:uncharacterized membrane protein YgcG